jgi:tetratricopeptide (TPR) repeat protein
VLQARLADQLTYLSLFTVGIIRYSTEDWAEAILLFNDALDKHPKPDSLLMTSNIRLYRGIAYEKAELYKEAAEDFTKFLEGVPIHATAFAHRAHVYYQQDKLEEALADNEKVIQIDPDNARAYFNRAIILQDLGEFEESIDSLSKAAVLKENFCVYVRRSYSFMKIGDYEAASEDLERALEFRSDSAIIYYYQGRVYQGQNELESAVESFTLAIKFDREFSDAYNGRGIAYANSGEIDKAIADYTSAIAIKEDATYYYNRGLAFQNTDQLKPALRDFSEAISLDSNNPVYRLSRALIYLDREETESALIDLQQYLALAPDAENREDIKEVIEELEQQITD